MDHSTRKRQVRGYLDLGKQGVFVAEINGTSYLLRDYDFNGNLIWTRPLGNFTGRTISIYADAEDVYETDALTLRSQFKTGTSLVQKHYPNGTLTWTDTYSCDQTGIAGESSGIYLTGTVYAGGVTDGFLGKYDLNGNQLWTASFSPHGYGSVAGVEAKIPADVFLIVLRV